MKIYEFSEKSVKLAEAAHILGFTVIEKDEIPILRGKGSKIEVAMSNIKTRCVLDSSFFPELLSGEKISVPYIMYWKECNESYMKILVDDVTEALAPAHGIPIDKRIESHTDNNGASFLMNFEIKNYSKFKNALIKFRKKCPEKGSYVFLKKEGWGRHSKDASYGSVWMTKYLGNITDIFRVFDGCDDE